MTLGTLSKNSRLISDHRSESITLLKNTVAPMKLHSSSLLLKQLCAKIHFLSIYCVNFSANLRIIQGDTEEIVYCFFLMCYPMYATGFIFVFFHTLHI